ncbi:hypothetical protein [Endozoicomonas sp. 8E]|uniref:hypothetical protein n=1 Tax=Endozoicomonas sp. 8E TaxID=3035692 RepID=UPI0029391305|nr:hypothetical protein [Endozoicomonas sp. 8E]WOG28609.1 hypothetical protein P6910_02830 [Endozoicomonas sp. 8E]
MNYQSTDAFAGGFARGFGLVNSAIDAKENRQYRKEMMGMQKGLHDRRIQKKDMHDKVNVLQALQHLSASDDPAERQLAQDIFAQSSNGAAGDLLATLSPWTLKADHCPVCLAPFHGRSKLFSRSGLYNHTSELT